MKNINDLHARAYKSAAKPAPSAFEPAPQTPMTVARISEELGGQIGQPDLGVIGNWQHKNFNRALRRNEMNTISAEQSKQTIALSLDALKASAELIREEMRVEWGRAYAVLGEKAVASEMSSIRKFEAVLETGRELLYGDRGDVFDRLVERYAAGLLTDADYEFELQHTFERYQRLLEEFTQIANERSVNVRTAFRNSNGR